MMIIDDLIKDMKEKGIEVDKKYKKENCSKPTNNKVRDRRRVGREWNFNK